MKINVLASTHLGFVAEKEKFEEFSGKAAGVCYMSNAFENLMNEDPAKTQRRVVQTKTSGHHSVYDHNNISLYLEGVPKALAMVLNNEKQYTTSEKSARYTKMEVTEKEQLLYDEWCETFAKIIKEKYQEEFPVFFTENRIKKLALENARFLISVFTPTTLIYTTTYRQLNYLYGFMQKEINNENSNKFYEKLKPYMIEFCEKLKNDTPYIDDVLVQDNKGRTLSLYNENDLVEYFGDVYATNYKASFQHIASALRHRTLSYSIKLLDETEFFVPPILDDYPDLKVKWMKDCESLKDNFPQGMLIWAHESGTFDNFVLKLMERKCMFTQIEISNQTEETLKKYVAGLKKINHPRAQEMEQYTKGPRCTFAQFKCTAPCGIVKLFKNRKI